MSLNSRNTPESILFLERLPNQAQTTQKFEAKVQEMSKGKRLSRGSPFYSSHLNFCVIIAFVPTRAVIKGNGGAIVSHQKNSRSNLIILACIKMLEIPGNTLKLNKNEDPRIIQVFLVPIGSLDKNSLFFTSVQIRVHTMF